MRKKTFAIEIRNQTDFLAELKADIRRVEQGRKAEEPTERVFFESIDAANRLLTPKRGLSPKRHGSFQPPGARSVFNWR